MAINYTYPVKAVPTVSDNVLIIDNEDTTNPRSTKTATIQSIVNLASGGGGGGGVTSVTGTSPVVSSGGTTPAISMAAATTSANGYLTSTDWNTFNNKLTTVSGDLTPVLSGNLDVNNNSIVSAGGLDVKITPNGAGNVVLDGIKYPQADGAAGQVLQTNGAGQLSFAAAGGGATIGGADTQVQYNDSGAFGAGAFFTTNKSSKVEVTNELGLLGDGTNHGILKIYCENGSAHYVGIKGPNHAGGSTYTLQLPNTLPAVANQVLESNATGTLSWIPTGLPLTGGTMTGAINGNQDIIGKRPIVTDTNTTINLTLGTHEGSFIYSNSVSAVTVTILPNATQAFSIGTEIDLIQAGGGQVTVTPAAGVNLNGANTSIPITAQWGGATLKQITLDNWIIVGKI